MIQDDWKIGDIIQHYSEDGQNLKSRLDLDYIEDCKKYHCINLSLRGRKAAASTAKKVRRDEKGRFTKKYNKITGLNGIRDTLAMHIDTMNYNIQHGKKVYWNSYDEADKILDIIKGNI